MVISNNELRRNVLEILTDIQVQIDEVKKEAALFTMQPSEVKDHNGNWVMVPLLLAKIQAISTLIQLNESERARKGVRGKS